MYLCHSKRGWDMHLNCLRIPLTPVATCATHPHFITLLMRTLQVLICNLNLLARFNKLLCKRTWSSVFYFHWISRVGRILLYLCIVFAFPFSCQLSMVVILTDIFVLETEQMHLWPYFRQLFHTHIWCEAVWRRRHAAPIFTCDWQEQVYNFEFKNLFDEYFNFDHKRGYFIL